MSERRWQQISAATGVVFVVLVAIIPIAIPTAPTPKDSAAKIATYYAHNRSAVLTEGYLSGLALVFFFWFVGVLRGYLRRAEGEPGSLASAALAGGVATGMAALVGAMIFSATAFKVAAEGDLHVVRALFDLQYMAFTFYYFPFAVLAAATSAVGLRTGALPTWLSWAGIPMALLSLLAAAAIYVDSGPLVAVDFFVYLLSLAWVLAVSIVLILRAGTRSAA